MKYDLKIAPGSTLRKCKALEDRCGIKGIRGVEIVKLSGGENGWSLGDMRRIENEGGVLVTTYGGLIEAQKAVELEIEQVATLSTGYIAAVKKIRSDLPNDIESIAKSTSRLQAESLKVQRDVTAACELWNSPAMLQAINNAERLAVALDCISKLQKNSVTFAVMGGNQ